MVSSGGSSLISSSLGFSSSGSSSLVSSSLGFSGSSLSLFQFADQLIPFGFLSGQEAGLVAVLLALFVVVNYQVYLFRGRLGLFRGISIVATVLRVIRARSTNIYFFKRYLTINLRLFTFVVAINCLRN